MGRVRGMDLSGGEQGGCTTSLALPSEAAAPQQHSLQYEPFGSPVYSVDFNRQARLPHGTISRRTNGPRRHPLRGAVYTPLAQRIEKEKVLEYWPGPAELRRLGVVGATTKHAFEAEYMLKPTPSPSSRAVSRE